MTSRLVRFATATLFLWASLTMAYMFFHIARYGTFQAVAYNAFDGAFELIVSLIAVAFAVYYVHREVK